MKRYQGRELHELPYFPPLWRDQLTDFLSFFTIHSRIYQSIYPLILGLLNRSKKTRLIDLCAGAGVYDGHLVRALRSMSGSQEIHCMLTDLYPHRRWEVLAGRFTGMLDVEMRSYPALKALEDKDGIFVMFSALHHFEEKELIQLLETADAAGKTVAFFDYSQRNLWIESIPVLLSGVLLLLFTPLVYPFSWKRLFFTYIFPVLPVLLVVDGFLSKLRAYTVAELDNVIQQAHITKGKVFCGKMPHFGGIANVHYLILEME